MYSLKINIKSANSRNFEKKYQNLKNWKRLENLKKFWKSKIQLLIFPKSKCQPFFFSSTKIFLVQISRTFYFDHSFMTKKTLLWVFVFCDIAFIWKEMRIHQIAVLYQMFRLDVTRQVIPIDWFWKLCMVIPWWLLGEARSALNLIYYCFEK